MSTKRAVLKSILILIESTKALLAILALQICMYVGTIIFILFQHDFLEPDLAMGILIYLCVAIIGTIVNLEYEYTNSYNSNFRDVSNLISKTVFQALLTLLAAVIHIMTETNLPMFFTASMILENKSSTLSEETVMMILHLLIGITAIIHLSHLIYDLVRFKFRKWFDKTEKDLGIKPQDYRIKPDKNANNEARPLYNIYEALYRC